MVAYNESVPEDIVCEKEDPSGLYEAVKSLEEPVRTVIVLFYLQGFSIREISSLLKVTQGSVKTRLYRGRKMLKELLEGVYEYE